MKSTKIIFVGGFLGAGKTTLLWETAQLLVKKNLKVGLITNDQAPELVDSVLLSRENLQVEEVSGSCFCCNFNGLIDALHKLRKEEITDVIIAEPVGSCTDLSATIMQPLKKFAKETLQVASLTVLADPNRLNSIIAGDNAGLHEDAAYIYGKQLEESDIILITKTDLLNNAEIESLKKRTSATYPQSKVMSVSAATGEGLDQWLNEVLLSNNAGKRIIEVDYDKYANGEAVLGWLNGKVRITGQSTNWDKFVADFMTELSRRFDSGSYAVGHVKVVVENGDKLVVANLTGKSETLTIREVGGTSGNVRMTINARVETTPENLDQIIKETLSDSTKEYDVDTIAWRFLQPGRPEPTHRFAQVEE